MNWFDILKTDLEGMSYHKSQVDSCLLYSKEPSILTYINDCVIVSHKKDLIMSLINYFKNGP